MKKVIIVCISINIVLFIIFSYFLFFKQGNEVSKMIDVTKLSKEEVIEKLEEYNLEFFEISSKLEKDIVVYTDPMVNEFIQKNQTIKIYISNGIVENFYENLINKYYEDTIEYLNYLEKEKNVNIVIKKQLSDKYPDGLIISQSSNGIIDNNDTFTILVNYNNPLIHIPNLIGKKEREVLQILEDLALNVIFIYEENDGSLEVFYQSINPNSLVISGTILYLHISI